MPICRGFWGHVPPDSFWQILSALRGHLVASEATVERSFSDMKRAFIIN